MRSIKTWELATLVLAVASVSAWACDKSKPCSGKKTATTVASTTDGRSESEGAVATPCAHEAKAATATPCSGGCKGCSHAASRGAALAATVGNAQKAPCSAHANDVKTAATAGSAPCGKNCDENCAKNCPHAKQRIAAAAADSSSPAREKANAILASLPTIRYRVGDETTSCPKHAKALAGAGGTVQYVVGDEAFATEDEAVTKLAELTENEVNHLLAVSFVVADESFECPMTAKKVAADKHAKIAYRVASFDFAERDQADKAVELAKAAASNVKTSYKVGDESFCCDRMASAKAAETHKPIVYDVAGSSTPCAVTAKRLMAEAKVRAIVEAAGEQAGL